MSFYQSKIGAVELDKTVSVLKQILSFQSFHLCVYKLKLSHYVLITFLSYSLIFATNCSSMIKLNTSRLALQVLVIIIEELDSQIPNYSLAIYP